MPWSAPSSAPAACTASPPIRPSHAPCTASPSSAVGTVAAEDPAGAPPGRREGAEAVQRKGLRAALSAAEAAHPGERIALWFMYEARIGQKGRLCHRWWAKGHRPPGRHDKRFESVYLFAAVEPATGAEVALVLPEATTVTMNLFLAEFGRGLPEDVHAALVLDGAGWHGAKELDVPANVTLVHLPPSSPQLNPVEQVWLYLRERCLSLRVSADHRAIVDACCQPWNRLAAEPGRLQSLCNQPWIRKVTS